MAKWNLDKQLEHPCMPKEHEYEEYVLEEEELDSVNHPPHYGKGNTKKYLHRYRYKETPLQDLRKAQWYLDRLIEEMEGE